jgi:YD repeat-containing protein
MVGIYELTATDIASGANVSAFSQPVQLTLRFTPDDLGDLMSDTVRLWYWDPLPGEWTALTPRRGQPYAATASISHFSVYGGSADPAISQGPFTMHFNTNLHAGSATGAIPIELPAGPGGLTPNLTLTYDSGRVNDMKSSTALASWVGTGWSLGTGAINLQRPPGGAMEYFLELDGVGGELVGLCCSLWSLKQTNHWDIRSDGPWGAYNYWIVKDLSGRTFTFGNYGSCANHVRYYYQPNGTGGYDQRKYQWDLCSIADLSGNIITFTYVQLMAGNPNDQNEPLSVRDARVSEIAWGGGRYRARLTPKADPARPDANCSLRVMESHALERVDVEVNVSSVWQTLRAYVFSYTTSTGCGAVHRLDSLQLTGRSGGVLQTYTFTYSGTTSPSVYPTSCGDGAVAPNTCGYRMGGNAGCAFPAKQFNRPLLTRLANGFGGATTYQYQELGIPIPESCLWSRVVVASKKVLSGSLTGADITTSYQYADGPAEERYFTRCQNDNCQGYLGFGDVTETDGAGNTVRHRYYTNGYFSYNQSEQTRTGREFERWARDANGVLWNHTSWTWAITPFIGYNFIWLADTTSTAKGSAKSRMSYTYGAFGELATETYHGNHAAGNPNATADDTTTYNTYLTPVTGSAFLVLLSQQDVKDAAGAVLRSTTNYYDNSCVSTAPLTPTSKGRLTRVETLLKGTPLATTNVYYNYAVNGNITEVTVPTTSPCSTSGPPAGAARTTTAYDPTFTALPTSETNPLGQVTQYQNYDFVLGKPTRVTTPDQHWVETRFDQYARPTKSWDYLGTDDTPQTSYTYNWGTAGAIQTIASNRVPAGGTESVRASVACQDGLGRVFMTKSPFNSAYYAEVRTDYDNRGNKLAVTNAFDGGTNTSCDTAAVSAKDRTTFEYDASGAASRTTFIGVSPAASASTQEIRDGGLTMTSIDERGNRTRQVLAQAVGASTASTLTVYESLSPDSTLTLRPSQQLFYAAWRASPDVGANHYLNIAETTADDATTMIIGETGGPPNKKDTHLYHPTSTFPPGTVIHSVTLRFRWRHNFYDDAHVNDMSAIFRQNGVDTRGPAYRRTAAQGWGDDRWEMTLNPRTGLPWTLTEVSANLEFGFELYQHQTQPEVTQAYLEIVTYTAGQTTTYTYDRLGQLTGVDDALGNHTGISYDDAGRKTAMSDPDMGAWSYTYDIASNLTTQTDARSVVTSLTYDVLSRVLTKSYSGGSPPVTDPSVTFKYDTLGSSQDLLNCAFYAPGFDGMAWVGRLRSTTVGTTKNLFCYDVRGRPVMSRTTLDSVNYDINTAYNDANEPTTVTYTDGEIVTNAYDASGNLIGVTSSLGETLLSNVALMTCPPKTSPV